MNLDRVTMGSVNLVVNGFYEQRRIIRLTVVHTNLVIITENFNDKNEAFITTTVISNTPFTGHIVQKRPMQHETSIGYVSRGTQPEDLVELLTKDTP